MRWHVFLVHDDYGTRVGKALGMTLNDIERLAPLQGQVLTDEDKARLQKMGRTATGSTPKA